MALYTLLKEMLRGKTLSRTLLNEALRGISLKGNILDLGSRNKQSSYYRFMDIEPSSTVVFSDLNPTVPGMLKVDLNEALPFDAHSQDGILMIHVLYLLKAPREAVRECYRVLRDGGTLVGAVPFLFPVCPEPIDYYRFTDTTLREMFAEAGFREVSIQAFGCGPVTAGIAMFSHLLKIKVLVFLLTVFGIGIDRLLNLLFPGRLGIDAAYYPLAYLFVARK